MCTGARGSGLPKVSGTYLSAPGLWGFQSWKRPGLRRPGFMGPGASVVPKFGYLSIQQAAGRSCTRHGASQMRLLKPLDALSLGILRPSTDFHL